MASDSRVVSFVDRFGREHVFLFLAPEVEKRCASAYGAVWPEVKRCLAQVHRTAESLRELTKK